MNFKNFPQIKNMLLSRIKKKFQNLSPKVRSQSIFSKSSHSSNSDSSRSLRASLAELELKRQQAEVLACQKNKKLRKKNKTTRTSKGTRARNGERKGVPRISRSAEQP